MRQGFWVLMAVVMGWSVWLGHMTTPSLGAAGGGDGTNVLVSVASDGMQGNSDSFLGVVSADGAWVAFISQASNLVPDDTNQAMDLFLRYLPDGVTTRISMGWDGSQASVLGLNESAVRMSADARYIAFASRAMNLVQNDSTEEPDCFLYDRESGTMELVSVTSDEQQIPAYSCALEDMTPDGRYLTFSTSGSYSPEDGGTTDVYLRDRETGTTTLVSRVQDENNWEIYSRASSISDDGRWITFESNSETLVPNDTNEVSDVFLFDRLTESTTRVSVASDGTQGTQYSISPVIAGDGHTVFFVSTSTNLTPADAEGADVFAHDRVTGETTWVSVGPATGGGSFPLSDVMVADASTDGRYVLMDSWATNMVPNDTNGTPDLFIRDRAAEITFRVSVANDGSQANGHSGFGALSADGRRVVFSSNANNLVPEGTAAYISHVFLRTLDDTPLPTVTPSMTATATPTRLPNVLFLPLIVRNRGFLTLPRLTNLTAEANGASFAPVTDGDGDTVAFLSEATNLVAGDTNGVVDAFVWSLAGNAIRRVSVASDGTEANAPTTDIVLSDDGRYVLLRTAASNLAIGDTNGLEDVYRHDLWTGVTEWVSVGLNGAAPDRTIESADMSADGRWIVFSSAARNITTTPLPTCFRAVCETLYRRDMVTGVTETWFTDGDGFALAPLEHPSISDDGQSVAYEQIELLDCPQYYARPSIYLYDAALQQHELIAISNYHSCNDRNNVDVMLPRLAGDGSTVIYGYSRFGISQYGGVSEYKITTYQPGGPHHEANLLYIFHEYATQSTSLSPSQPPFYEGERAISADGTMAVFIAPDLKYPGPIGSITIPFIADDRNEYLDIYRHDLNNNHYVRISNGQDGALANGDSTETFLAADGGVVVFASEADNLTVGDGNHVKDIFLWQGIQ